VLPRATQIAQKRGKEEQKTDIIKIGGPDNIWGKGKKKSKISLSSARAKKKNHLCKKTGCKVTSIYRLVAGERGERYTTKKKKNNRKKRYRKR